MTDAHARRRSIDDLLADTRAQLDRVEPASLTDKIGAGAIIVDIRPVEQRTRAGALPSAIIVDRTVLEWRLDPTSAHRITEIDGHDTRRDRHLGSPPTTRRPRRPPVASHTLDAGDDPRHRAARTCALTPRTGVTVKVEISAHRIVH